jgi:hypothetical protein
MVVVGFIPQLPSKASLRDWGPLVQQFKRIARLEKKPVKNPNDIVQSFMAG